MLKPSWLGSLVGADRQRLNEVANSDTRDAWRLGDSKKPATGNRLGPDPKSVPRCVGVSVASCRLASFQRVVPSNRSTEKPLGGQDKDPEAWFASLGVRQILVD